jgi:hypothetical protein
VLRTLADLHVARLLPSGSYAPGSLMGLSGAFLAGRHSLLAASVDILDRLVTNIGST